MHYILQFEVSEEEILDQLGKKVICFDLEFDVGYNERHPKDLFRSVMTLQLSCRRLFARTSVYAEMELSAGRGLQLKPLF